MEDTFRIYGHGDTRKGYGFETPKQFRDYIGGEIFTLNQQRYRYSESAFAKTIVLSRHGRAYGHFEVDRAEVPTPEDIADYDRVKTVFIVTKSYLYKKPVVLKDLGYIVKQRGLPIERADFKRIIEKAVGLQSFTPDDPYPTKYCRVCYNTKEWRKPAGAAEEVGTYFSDNGFGHEEWLFRYEWCIGGLKYGFLQPFTRHLKKYQGSTFNLKLYTNHRGHTFFVGRIKKVYVPHDGELAEAYAAFESRGWLDQMRAEVAEVKGKVEALGNNTPNLVLNVRFDPADVIYFADMPEFPEGSKPTRAPYYTLYDDDEVIPPKPPLPTLTRQQRDKLRVIRAAQQGTVVELLHAEMQDKLYLWLCERHGADAVGFEIDNVDLRLTVHGEVTFFELKTDSSAQRCIRNAMGQLFEYSSYPAQAKAHRWIVVGDPAPTADDCAYLHYLRTTYAIPLYYARFDWSTGGIGNAV